MYTPSLLAAVFCLLLQEFRTRGAVSALFTFAIVLRHNVDVVVMTRRVLLFCFFWTADIRFGVQTCRLTGHGFPNHYAISIQFHMWCRIHPRDLSFSSPLMLQDDELPRGLKAICTRYSTLAWRFKWTIKGDKRTSPLGFLLARAMRWKAYVTKLFINFCWLPTSWHPVILHPLCRTRNRPKWLASLAAHVVVYLTTHRVLCPAISLGIWIPHDSLVQRRVPLYYLYPTVFRSLCTSPSEFKPLKRKNHELIDGIFTRNLFVFRQRAFLLSLWVEAGTMLVALSRLISEYNGETHWMLLNGILSVGIYWSVPLAPKRDP